MTTYAKEILRANCAATVARGAVVGFLALQVAACAAMRPVAGVAGNESSGLSDHVAKRATPASQQWPEWLLRESAGAAPTMAMINPPWVPWKGSTKINHSSSGTPVRPVVPAVTTMAAVTQHVLSPAPAVTRASSAVAAPVATKGPEGTKSAPKPVELAMLSNSNPDKVMKSLSDGAGTSVDDDAVLAKQRGRGIAGSNVVYFGLQMTTNALGGTGGFNATAGLQFAMNDSNVVVNQAWTVQSGSPSFATSGNTVSGELSNSGVGQLVQVAGNGNGGTNATIINITHDGHLDFSPPPASTGCGSGVNCQAGIGLGGVATSVSLSGLMGSNVINMANGISQQVAINTVNAVVNNILTLNVELGSQNTTTNGFLSNLLHNR